MIAVSKNLLNDLKDIVRHDFEDLDWGDGEEWDKIDIIWDKLKAWCCKASGQHDFMYDQCGYWHHQFCSFCGESKYPDIHSLKCSEVKEKYGSEEEYIEKNNIKTQVDFAFHPNFAFPCLGHETDNVMIYKEPCEECNQVTTSDSSSYIVFPNEKSL